jgi:cytochrome c biogenesis protein CcmG, thiol:disulfide interchange protein DsbE
MNARRGAGAVAVLLALVTLTAPAPRAAADASRFVPWKGETPTLSLKDVHGKVHALADYRGKVVLVNFWATWCEPCKDEMPSMVKLKEKLAAQPFEVLVVNFGESPSRVGEFLARENLTLTALLDPNKAAARAWRVRVLPGSFLLGRDGRARYTVIGELDWATETAVQKVRELLGGVAYGRS